VVGCRSIERVHRILDEALVDAVVMDVRRGLFDRAVALTADFPTIPLFVLSPFRPGDGPLMARCVDVLPEVYVTGVDDPVIGEIIASRRAAQSLRSALSSAPRLLRLTEEVQLRAWNEILERVDSPITTADLAEVMGVSREHLSREFAAGGAPNLKRIIDLARLACAARLLTNPAYSVGSVARILRFSSASHLAGSARRIAAAKPSALADLGPGGVLRRFAKGRTRSRL
jgi:AraC-like DNA-binding protein